MVCCAIGKKTQTADRNELENNCLQALQHRLDIKHRDNSTLTLVEINLLG